MSKHTATPWSVDPENARKVIGADGSFVADCNGLADEDCDAANAAHIVRCVNSHDALVSALQSAEMVFREAGIGIQARGEYKQVCDALALAAAKGDA